MSRQTRAERAEILLQRIARGPAGLIETERTPGFGPLERWHYRAWFETWIQDELLTLIPELRAHKHDFKEINREFLDGVSAEGERLTAAFNERRNKNK